jgi:hypothetical protein
MTHYYMHNVECSADRYLVALYIQFFVEELDSMK